MRLVLAAHPRRGGRTLADFAIRLRCQERGARPAADGVLRPWPVSRAVNSVRNNGAELLDPMDDPHAQPLSAALAGRSPA